MLHSYPPGTIHAIDFDGFLCENAWPEIGEANEAVIRYFIALSNQGNKLILWTCREGQMLGAAVMWCYKHGLRFDAVNANLPERIAQYGTDPRKIGADVYWDDRNGFMEELNG